VINTVINIILTTSAHQHNVINTVINTQSSTHQHINTIIINTVINTIINTIINSSSTHQHNHQLTTHQRTNRSSTHNTSTSTSTQSSTHQHIKHLNTSTHHRMLINSSTHQHNSHQHHVPTQWASHQHRHNVDRHKASTPQHNSQQRNLSRSLVLGENCEKACDLVYSPVCGSDGHTYSNHCFLQIETCQTGGVVTEVGKGSCPPTGEISFGETVFLWPRLKRVFCVI
jgi:hypothetical protein